MRVLRSIPIILALLLASNQAQAVDFEKLLVPLRPGLPTPGAGGSLWKVEFSFINHASAGVQMEGFVRCGSLCPPDLPPFPSGTAFSPMFVGTSRNVPAHFLYVEVPYGDLVETSLRVRDLSRQSETWGAAVPTPSEKHAAQGRAIELFDVPVVSGFRHTLRVYSFDPRPGALVRVNFYTFDPSKNGGDQSFNPPDRLLASRDLPLYLETAGGGASWYPGYAVMNGFSDIPEISGQERVRVEVVPEPADRIWAMVSVTHDVTQQVTVIAPN